MRTVKLYVAALLSVVSLVFVSCDNNRHAGGVTDIGNSIAGRVVFDDGSPAAKARVVAYYDAWNNGSISDSVVTETNEAGKFILENVKDSAKVFFASKDSACALSKGSGDDSLKITLGRPKNLSGSILSATSGSMRIVGSSLSVPVSKKGTFEFDSIPPGDLSIVYSSENIPQARFEFSTVDSRDTIALPALVELAVADTWLIISDSKYYADGGYGGISASSIVARVSVPLLESPTETLYGFVLPVKFNDLIDFGKFSSPDSFAVISSDGTELPFEEEYWTAKASQGVLWVRLDSLEAGADSIHLYLVPRDVPFSPSGAYLISDSVVAALHLNGDANIYNATDSDKAYGIIGYGATLTSGQYISLDSINPCSNDFTLSLWVLWNGINDNHQILFAERASWADSTLFEWYYENDDSSFAAYDVYHLKLFPKAVSAIAIGEWAYLNLVSKDDSLTMYVNGVAVSGPTYFASRKLEFNVPFRVGGNDIATETWNGSLDEIRVETEARSAEWLRMEYLTQLKAAN